MDCFAVCDSDFYNNSATTGGAAIFAHSIGSSASSRVGGDREPRWGERREVGCGGRGGREGTGRALGCGERREGGED